MANRSGAVHAVACRLGGPTTVPRFQPPLSEPCMRFSRTRLAPVQSARGIPLCHQRWPRAQATFPPRRGPAGDKPFGNPAASSVGCTLGWRPFAPAGSVVHALHTTMASSDSRSALPRFVGAPLIGFDAPSPPLGLAPQGSSASGGLGRSA